MAGILNAFHLFIFRRPELRPSPRMASLKAATAVIRRGMWFVALQSSSALMMASPYIAVSRNAGLKDAALFAVVMKMATFAVMPRAVSYTHLTLPTKRIV